MVKKQSKLESILQVVDAEQAVEPLNFLHYLQTSLGDHDQSVPVLDNFKDRQVSLIKLPRITPICRRKGTGWGCQLLGYRFSECVRKDSWECVERMIDYSNDTKRS